MKILYVEDESIIALGLKMNLQKTGNYVTHVVNKEDALDQFESSVFDLIILDINLIGDMDGLFIASKIREKSNIPIIFTTGYGDKSTIDLMESIPYSKLIAKPIDFKKLKTSVDYYANI